MTARICIWRKVVSGTLHAPVRWFRGLSPSRGKVYIHTCPFACVSSCILIPCIPRRSERIQPDHSQPVHPRVLALWRREGDDWISFMNSPGINKMSISNHRCTSSHGPGCSRKVWHMIRGGAHGVSLHVKVRTLWSAVPLLNRPIRSRLIVKVVPSSFPLLSYSSLSLSTIADHSVRYFRFEIAPRDIRRIFL